MINWIKTAELNNITIEDIIEWIETPPHNKRVIRICDKCGDEKEIGYRGDYYSLCSKCGSYQKKGGKDMVEHHWLYDHANPELYTRYITRSLHTKLHNWMRKNGLEVPHINEEVGPWKYSNQ